MTKGSEIISLLSDRQDREQFRRKNWIGTFEQYLDIVRQTPEVTRTAYQRLYDMILSYGVEVIEKGREPEYRYNFFDDPDNDGRDAVFGLRGPLHKLVNALKSAAHEYGIEKRVLLLHGPVGSSKSTIVRLLKQGLQYYSTKDEGALYTLGWVDEENPDEVHWCPMNEEPLHLIPERFRADVANQLRRRLQSTNSRRTRSVLPLHVPPETQKVRRRLDTRDPGCSRQASPAERKGSCGNWHVPTQGRKKPGRNRADR